LLNFVIQTDARDLQAFIRLYLYLFDHRRLRVPCSGFCGKRDPSAIDLKGVPPRAVYSDDLGRKKHCSRISQPLNLVLFKDD